MPIVSGGSSGGSGGGGVAKGGSIGPVGSGIAALDFTSIPASGSHLLVIGQLRSVAAAATDTMALTLNGDTGANYGEITIGTQGLATTLSGSAFGSSNLQYQAVGDTAPVGYATSFFFWIPNYAGATFVKSIVGGYMNFSSAATAGAKMEWRCGLWVTAGTAVNRVTVTPGSNLKPGSFATYYIMA